MIKHKLGILNHADSLSCQPDYPSSPTSSEEVSLSPSVFVNALLALDLDLNIIVMP
jgi:hypothetical protein